MVTQTTVCPMHNVQMTQRISQKTGNPYFAHSLGGKNLCFGNPPKDGQAYSPARSGTARATALPKDPLDETFEEKPPTLPQGQRIPTDVFNGFVNWGDLWNQAQILAPAIATEKETGEQSMVRAFRLICSEIRNQATQ